MKRNFYKLFRLTPKDILDLMEVTYKKADNFYVDTTDNNEVIVYGQVPMIDIMFTEERFFFNTDELSKKLADVYDIPGPLNVRVTKREDSEKIEVRYNLQDDSKPSTDNRVATRTAGFGEEDKRPRKPGRPKGSHKRPIEAVPVLPDTVRP